MDVEKNNKIEFWRNHLVAAQSDPNGITAYCKLHGLRSATYYGWRKKLKVGISEPKKVSIGRPKIPRSPFLPVAVSVPETKFQNRSPALPNAKWVAEVMLHLIRGLE